jgi:hypothetical protein
MLAVSTTGEAMRSATQVCWVLYQLAFSSGPQEVRTSKDRLEQLMARRRRKSTSAIAAGREGEAVVEVGTP